MYIFPEVLEDGCVAFLARCGQTATLFLTISILGADEVCADITNRDLYLVLHKEFKGNKQTANCSTKIVFFREARKIDEKNGVISIDISDFLANYQVEYETFDTLYFDIMEVNPDGNGLDSLFGWKSNGEICFAKFLIYKDVKQMPCEIE